VIHSDCEVLFEAPNWTESGHLIVNGGGKLWSLPASGGVPQIIPIDGIPDVNNDHVLAPDHESIFISTNDDWQIYHASISGGSATRVTPSSPNVMHFLHGVNATANQLAYVQIHQSEQGLFSNGKVHLLDLESGSDTVLLGGDAPEDGPEYSANGEWIYLNTEHFDGGVAGTPGHAQIAKARLDGSELTQLTFDQNVNWFPHLAPNGERWAYISFPAGTLGHPADLPVAIKVVENEEWDTARTVATLFGGQGTINVNSWSPDSKCLAYVSYPLA
jgi:Tol biopolymer transport system component